MLTRWRRWSDRWAFVLIAVVLLAILAPVLFRPGYLLMHDWAWTPSGMAFSPYRAFPAGEWLGSGAYPPNWAPLQALFTVIGWVLPEPLIQRLFLVGLLALLASGAYRLAPGESWAPRAFAATLAVVNPWTFDRLMSGQWPAVAGFAALGWALWALLRALRRDDMRSLVLAGLAWAFAGVFDTHTFYLLGPVPLIAALVHGGMDGNRWRSLAARVPALYAIAIGLSCYWTIPAAAGVSGLERITHADLGVYATVADGRWGLLFNTASMHGYWYNDGASKAGLTIWPVLFLALGGLAIWGLVVAARRREQRPAAVTMALVGVAAWLAAMGDQGPTGPLYAWTFDHLPGMHGLRDAQRAAAFLPFVYGYFGALGVAAIATWFAPGQEGRPVWERAGAFVLAFLIVCTYTFRIFWFGLGERQPSEYPASWRETRAIVAKHPESAVLVLPWQRFMKLPFTHDQNVINPAPRYFGGTVFSGDNDLIPVASGTSGDARHAYIAALLERAPAIDHFGNLVSVLGVRYVFLPHGPGYADSQTFLDRQQDLKRIRQWPDADLYENQVPSTVVYASGDVREAASIDDLVRASATTPLAAHVWVARATTNAPSLRSSRAAAATFDIGPSSTSLPVGGDPRGRYLQAAAVRPDGDWSVAGSQRVETITPVIAFAGDGARFTRGGLDRFAAGYAISGVTALGVLGLLVAPGAMQVRRSRRGRA